MDGVTVEQREQEAFYISTSYQNYGRISAYKRTEDNGETVIWCNYGRDLSLCMSPSIAKKLIEAILPLIPWEQDSVT